MFRHLPPATPEYLMQRAATSAVGRIEAPDPLVTSQVLYPELHRHRCVCPSFRAVNGPRHIIGFGFVSRRVLNPTYPKV